MKILKRRELWFCLIAYPALFLITKLLEKNLKAFASDNPALYGFSVFAVLLVVVVVSMFELVNRIWGHKLQGGKLKLREKEGVNLEDQL